MAARVADDVEPRGLALADDLERRSEWDRRHQVVDFAADADRDDVLSELSFARQLLAGHDQARLFAQRRLSHAESPEEPQARKEEVVLPIGCCLGGGLEAGLEARRYRSAL